MSTSTWKALSSYYEFKTPQVAEEFKEACEANTHFMVFCLLMGALAPKRIFVTDVWRDDKGSTHFWKRAFDGRVWNEGRDGVAAKATTMTNQDWLNLEGEMLKFAQYRGGNHRLVDLHGEGSNYHAHCQIGIFSNAPLEL